MQMQRFGSPKPLSWPYGAESALELEIHIVVDTDTYNALQHVGATEDSAYLCIISIRMQQHALLCHKAKVTLVRCACCRQDATFDGLTTYSINVLMGRRDEALLTLCARQLVELATASGNTKCGKGQVPSCSLCAQPLPVHLPADLPVHRRGIA